MEKMGNPSGHRPTASHAHKSRRSPPDPESRKGAGQAGPHSAFQELRSLCLCLSLSVLAELAVFNSPLPQLPGVI